MTWVLILNNNFSKIIYEIQGVSETIAKQALKTAAYKMPIQTKFLKVESKSE